MVSSIGLLWLLGHGADPTPLAWDEAAANLVKFGVSFLLISLMTYPLLAPLLSRDTDSPDTPSDEQQAATRDTAVWMALGLALVLSLAWWLTRVSLVEINTDEQADEKRHAHNQVEGGQVAMWGDYHAEIVRVESGEVRVYLRDSYNREIAARFFSAEVQDYGQGAQASSKFLPTTSSLNETYRFARLDPKMRNYRLKISTPGWSTHLVFDFDESRGRRSLPIWCAK